jgi:polar amino acid transport system permease protein
MNELNVLLPTLLRGAEMTLLITVISAPVALAVAIVAGLGRTAPWWPVRALATVYVEVFRGTSLLVQLFYFYYVLPLVGVAIDPVTTGVMALALNHGAYGAEVVRAGLGAVPRSQHEACISLGMSPLLALRRVIFPQAFLVMLPPFGNLLIELLKSTSLLSLITIFDLAFAGNSLFQTTGRTVEVYGLVLVIYFCMAMVLTGLMRWLEAWLGASREADFRS